MKEQTISNRQYKVRSLFAFSFFVLALCAGVFVWIMLRKEPRDTGIPATLRKGLMIDERIFSGLFSQNKLVKTYPKSEAVKQVRVNGDIGLKDPIIDTAT